MSKKPTGRIGGRDARTGEFIPISETKRRPATTVREIIPLPGHGDSGRGKGGKKGK
jgi:hypothetical protein